MSNWKTIGLVSETKVLAALVEKGLTVSIPYGDNARYDFVVEFEPGTLSRVQVKTGRYATAKAPGCILAGLYSTHTVSHKQTKYSSSEIDYFMLYCPELETVYKLPISEFESHHAYLRVDEPKSAQTYNTKWAKDYLF